ncbi:MAG: hypothetical protein PVF35_08055, partial [Gammaproteobacteria bacterium]|jgi:hypothetical protein
LLTTNISLAVTIDLPDYDFAAIADTANLNGSYTFNYESAELDITDSYATTYIYSNDTNATIDLKFDTKVYDGNGFDISVFLVGGGDQGHSFDLSLKRDMGTSSSVINFDSSTYTHYEYTGFCIDTDCKPIYRMDIDLNQFGFLGTNPVGTLHFDVSNMSAVPSLVAAYHLQPATVVPLPLPVILFSSGLAFLGFVGRRRKQTS